MKILFIQFGDYREAFNNLASGGGETYKAQRHSVDYVAGLQHSPGVTVCVLCVNSPADYDEYLPNGIRVVGFNKNNVGEQSIGTILDSFSPTHIILRTPLAYVIAYALKKQIHILPLFADYFANKNLRSWYLNKKLVKLLNNPAIAIVSNHNLPACESLARIGVARDKIAPWDWAAVTSPDDFPLKSNNGENIRLLYVGAVATDKGAFDCINAMAYLDYSQRDYTLSIIGSGDLDTARNLVSQLPKPEKVTIIGSIPNTKVLEEMVKSTIVIVPSHHEYPEGMPNTIYEGLTTRTPLLLSDHPVFTARFEDKRDVVFFKASQPTDLAEKIEFLITEPGLYESLSDNSKALWLKLQMPLKWADLISAWLEGSTAQANILAEFSLSATKR